MKIEHRGHIIEKRFCLWYWKWDELMHSSVCIKPQFTLTPSSSTKPLFNRFPGCFLWTACRRIRGEKKNTLLFRLICQMFPRCLANRCLYSHFLLWWDPVEAQLCPFLKILAAATGYASFALFEGSCHIKFHWSFYTLLIRLMTSAPLFRKWNLHQQLTCVLCGLLYFTTHVYWT